ncbi:hypothetical protein C8J57DRAFT_1255864 [Mycena rebaudengoi]|nr:hypothetical protein C8J57DRAFT_1255864 [Mycena rebaudengoi]
MARRIYRLGRMWETRSGCETEVDRRRRHTSAACAEVRRHVWTGGDKLLQMDVCRRSDQVQQIRPIQDLHGMAVRAGALNAVVAFLNGLSQFPYLPALGLGLARAYKIVPRVQKYSTVWKSGEYIGYGEADKKLPVLSSSHLIDDEVLLSPFPGYGYDRCYRLYHNPLDLLWWTAFSSDWVQNLIPSGPANWLTHRRRWSAPSHTKHSFNVPGDWVQKVNSYKVPWLYWELISNTDPHQGEDYEARYSHCRFTLSWI